MMWRLTKYAAVFAAGQLFQVAVENERQLRELHDAYNAFAKTLKERRR